MLDPKKLLEPVYSAEILVIGSRDGWFTGKKLSDYITLAKSNYVSARRIINGTDKALLIAGYAKEYNLDLKRIGYGEKAPPAPSQPSPAPKPAEPVKRDPEPSTGRFWSILASIFIAIFKGLKK